MPEHPSVSDTGARPDAPSAPPSFVTLTALAACFGLGSGLLESVMLGGAEVVLHRYTHQGVHVAWMAPTAYALAFVVLAMPLWAASRIAPRLAWLRIAVVLFGFLGAWGPLLLFARLAPWAAAILALGLAVSVSRLVTPRAAWFERTVRRAAPVLAAAVLVLWCGVSGWRAIAERRAVAGIAAPHGPNVLLIILDTVRSLNLALYGYPRATTPRLEALESRGVVFDRAVAPSSWTLPSHASLFTGLDPDRLDAGWFTPLGDDHPTLAQVLAARGYRTAGFVANLVYTTRESGLDRGFARYDDFTAGPGQFLMAANLGRKLWWATRAQRSALRIHANPNHKNADQVNAAALAWITGRDRDRPFFAFLNYFDAHAPYLPPAPFDTLFGRLPDDYEPELGVWEERAPTDAELRNLVLAYDQSIAYVDDRLGRLLDSLDALGVLDSTIVVVTSDHGEGFWEHALLSHGRSLYLETLAVPLLIVYPASVPGGRRVAHRVSLRDLSATILELAAAGEGAGLGGRSLSRFWTDHDAVADTLYAELRYAPRLPAHFPVSKGDLHTVLAGDLQYIQTADTLHELFDLARDPWQQRDLARDPAYRDSLAILQRWLSAKRERR